jgi:hypothetical protein
MRSLRWRIGAAESPEVEAGVCAGFWVFATPLGVVGLDGRWVIGLAEPWDHAFWAWGRLRQRGSALGWRPRGWSEGTFGGVEWNGMVGGFGWLVGWLVGCRRRGCSAA